MKNQTSKIKHQESPKGFTLIEVLIATVLIGLSIAALVGANVSFSMANVTGADLSTAEFLAEQIRELTTMLPVVEPGATTWTVLGPESGETTVALYDDVDDFDGFDSASLGAPISAQRTTLPDLSAFRQRVIVEKLNPLNFNEPKADSYTSNFVRVTVTILQSGRPISSASWIRARY
ncbi:MAG: prepilin-type N-terminal cleavage/methylation domain-containing protein [Phycisphaerae bacterium]|nr:prepilin-type N-terminal cleavage/methylation domain-containing protein [Phycisphaerae bacterium]